MNDTLNHLILGQVNLFSRNDQNKYKLFEHTELKNSYKNDNSLVSPRSYKELKIISIISGNSIRQIADYGIQKYLNDHPNLKAQADKIINTHL